MGEHLGTIIGIAAILFGLGILGWLVNVSRHEAVEDAKIGRLIVDDRGVFYIDKQLEADVESSFAAHENVLRRAGGEDL